MKKNIEKISAFFMGFVFSDALLNFDAHPCLSGLTMLFLGSALCIMILASDEEVPSIK